MLKLLERAAISERPSLRLVRSDSADSRAAVADGDGEALGVGLRFDRQRAGFARVGVDDDVHAGLGDDRLEIGDAGFVHADLFGEPGEGVTNHRDVLRPCGEPHVKPFRLLAGGGAVCH